MNIEYYEENPPAAQVDMDGAGDCQIRVLVGQREGCRISSCGNLKSLPADIRQNIFMTTNTKYSSWKARAWPWKGTMNILAFRRRRIRPAQRGAPIPQHRQHADEVFVPHSKFGSRKGSDRRR